ncbi:hypothetical protein G4228_006117 [Cervus hanglu yarkandensis]|nr:hypothetical protein G4228_006117 [Cervus hanglu yarkandensis]
MCALYTNAGCRDLPEGSMEEDDDDDYENMTPPYKDLPPKPGKRTSLRPATVPPSSGKKSERPPLPCKLPKNTGLNVTPVTSLTPQLATPVPWVSQKFGGLMCYQERLLVYLCLLVVVSLLMGCTSLVVTLIKLTGMVGLAGLKKDLERIRADTNQSLLELRGLLDCTRVTCPEGWLPFQGKCYYFSPSTKTWDEARTFCQENYSHLVIISNSDEQVRSDLTPELNLTPNRGQEIRISSPRSYKEELCFPPHSTAPLAQRASASATSAAGGPDTGSGSAPRPQTEVAVLDRAAPCGGSVFGQSADWESQFTPKEPTPLQDISEENSSYDLQMGPELDLKIEIKSEMEEEVMPPAPEDWSALQQSSEYAGLKVAVQMQRVAMPEPALGLPRLWRAGGAALSAQGPAWLQKESIGEAAMTPGGLATCPQVSWKSLLFFLLCLLVPSPCLGASQPHRAGL